MQLSVGHLVEPLELHLEMNLVVVTVQLLVEHWEHRQELQSLQIKVIVIVLQLEVNIIIIHVMLTQRIQLMFIHAMQILDIIARLDKQKRGVADSKNISMLLIPI